MCYIPGMIRVLPAVLAFALAFLAGSSAQAQMSSPWQLTRDDRDLSVSLVTFGPGGAIHQYFGHNALLVEDRARGVGVLYNFGMFSFGPDMLPKYLRGQLEFWSAATPVEPTYRHYVAENRSIRVRELDLPPARRRALADALATAVLPENRSYRYHHYANNCSTKVRDVIDQALSGQLSEQHSDTGRLTYRGHTRRYTEHDPIVHMLLMLWMNDSMERPIRAYDEAFLPDELDRLVASTTYVDADGRRAPLAGLSYTVFEARRPQVPATPSRVWPGLLAVGLSLGAAAVALAGWLGRKGSRAARVLLGVHHALLGLVLGLPGLVAGLFLFTAWDVTHHNENLLIANPLTFLALPFGIAMALGARWALRSMAVIWMALGASTLLLLSLKLLPAFDQDVWVPLALFGPVNIGCALAHVLLRRRLAARASAAPSASSGASAAATSS